MTIKDVAEYAGVSVATVSNTLNNPNVVKPKTRERVMQAVRELNYVPNVYGQNLKKQKQHRIGVFVANPGGVFYSIFLQVAGKIAVQNGYGVNLQIPNLEERQDIATFVMNGMVDGAIITHTQISKNDVERFVDKEFPVVFIDRELADRKIASVVIDNFDGAYQMTKHLLKSGCKRITYMHGLESYDDRKRYEGFRAALKEAELTPFLDGEFRCNFYHGDAYIAMKTFLANNSEFPDAIFAANDEMAHGCIDALQEFGFQVPEQIRVVGFDNITLSKYYTVPLTTVSTSTEELSQRVVEKLIRMIESDESGDVAFCSTELVLRESSK